MRLLLIIFLITTSVFAAGKIENKILPLYRDGDYLAVLDELEDFEQKGKELGKIYYWMALCYSKLQEFQSAASFYKKAVLIDSSPKDIYYRYGQALFGIDQIRQAKRAFLMSASRGYERNLSNYYAAHIAQRLEQWNQAIEYYEKVVGADDRDKDLIQLSYYQMGICKLEKNKQTGRAIFSKVRDKVIPLLELAYDENKNSKRSLEIRGKIYQLRQRYNLPEPTKEKKYHILFNQKLQYDNNVNYTTGDLSDTPPTYRESLISRTELMLQKKTSFLRKTRTIFELDSKYNYHFRQDSSDVYQYDGFTIAPAVRNEWTHQVNKKKMTMLFDLEYSQTHQDYQAAHELPFYSRTFSVVWGERFRIFDAGATLIKLRRKQYFSYSEQLGYVSNSLTFMQFFTVREKDMFLFVFNYDRISAEEEEDSTTGYYFRGDYMLSQFLWGLDLRVGSAVSFLDTKEQRTDRGVEIMLTPGVELSYYLSNHLSLSLNYEYTRNISKDKTLYDYSKQVIGFDLNLAY